MRKIMIAGLVGVLSLSTIACKSRDNTAEIMDPFIPGKSIGITVDCDNFDIKVSKENRLYERTQGRWISQQQVYQFIRDDSKENGDEARAPAAIAIFTAMAERACQS